MCNVKVVKILSPCLLLFCIALLAMNVVGAQEAQQAVPVPAAQPVVVPPPKITPAPAPAQSAMPQPDFTTTAPMVPASQRLNIIIDPKTPLANLLPPAPKNMHKPANRFLDDLRSVPEVTFQESLSSKLTSQKATYEIAHQLNKIRHVNQEKTDAFMEALIDHRADLRGMPFAMGEACRTLGARAKFLAFFSAVTRFCVAEATETNPSASLNADKFWALMSKTSQSAENEMAKGQHAQDCDDFEAARVAAVMQVLAPESAAVRLGLVKYLARTPHVDATKALVLFSAEDEVRVAAIHALKLRREKDYAPTLAQGFRYPLPEVAKRAADALIRLECTAAVPQLVDLLDEPDPRNPVTKEVQGKKVAVVHEMVRVNHHRNCMMCHAPADLNSANAGTVLPFTSNLTTVSSMPLMVTEEKQVMTKGPDGTKVEVKTFNEEVMQNVERKVVPSLTAQVPLPNEQLPSLSDGGYGRSGPPDVMVRIDVTYLRQDFSLLMPVHDAAPWPDMQRFDFLVRSRVLSPKEAEEYRQNAPKAVAGSTTPYQRAVLFALRELTLRDTAPTPQAWRELLALPGKGSP
jgi:hypothetical protein